MAMLKDNSKCFVCGKDNPSGLRATFAFDPATRTLCGSFSPRPEHAGWQGIVHGGIIAALLDEAMVKLSALLGVPSVSAEITVTFKAPAAPGDDLRVTAEIVRESGRLIEARATVARGPVVIGRAIGKLLRAPEGT